MKECLYLSRRPNANSANRAGIFPRSGQKSSDHLTDGCVNLRRFAHVLAWRGPCSMIDTVVTFRRVTSFAVVVAFLAGPCLSVCAGWDASPHARMACCAHKAADEADACCASAEGRENSPTPSPVAAFPVALEPVPFAWPIIAASPEPTQLDRDARHPLTPTTERHVLLSVFLI